MKLLAIDDLDLTDQDLAELPSITSESDDLAWSTRRQAGRQSQGFVGGSNEPAMYNITFNCNTVKSRRTIMGALPSDLSTERRLLALLGDEDDTRVVTYAAITNVQRVSQSSFIAQLEAADSLWTSEHSTLVEKTISSARDQVLHVPVPGMMRVSPSIRIAPLAQRTTKTALAGWSKRRRYIVTNLADEPLYRYPLRVDLGSTTALVSAGSALSSGNDVRIVIDGIERSRSLISWNSGISNSYCWFIIPSLLPGDSMTLEIWYGNASAGTPPLLAYPDLPAFSLSTSTNASWVYPLTAGIGLWWLSKSGPGAIADNSVPGAWQFLATLENPDSDDRTRQLRASDLGSGTSFAANLDASRAGGNSTIVVAENDFDGVGLYNPLGIVSITNGFSWTNVGGWNTAVLLARDSASEGWQTFFQFAGATGALGSAARSPAAATKWIAASVWPDDFVQLPPRDDTANTGPLATDYGRVAFTSPVTVAIDSSKIAIDLGTTAELPWTPATLGGKLKAFFYAPAIQGVANNATLSQWSDQTANARHATQDTGDQKPIYRKAQINGLAAVDFDGSNDRLNVNKLTASSRDETIVAVIRPDTSANGVILGSQDSGGRALRRNSTGTFSLVKSTGTVLATSTGTIANGAAGIVAVTINATQIIFSINGTVETAVSNSTTFTANVFTDMGDTKQSAQQFFNGLIGEVGSAVALSTADRQSWEGYAAWTWGLTALLPVGHPYKTVAPTASGTVGAVTEDDIYEIASAIQFGGGDDLAAPYTTLYVGNGRGESGAGTRRVACLLSEAIIIDAMKRSQEVWLADLTVKTEDISAHAVGAEIVTSDGTNNYTAPTPDWLPMVPGRQAVPNGDFATDIGGWEADETDPLLTVARTWDGAVGGEEPGSLAVTISANTAVANVYAMTVGAKRFPIAGRESIWVSAWMTTSNAVLRPRLYIRFFDEDNAVLTTAIEDPWTPVAGEEVTRQFAARVPGRAQSLQVGLAVLSTATGNLGTVWFDDVRVNDNDVLVSDQSVGQVKYTVQTQGLWVG